MRNQRLVKLTVFLTACLLCACDPAGSGKHEKAASHESPAPVSIHEALARDLDIELVEAVEISKRAGFPQQDLAIAVTALRKEMQNTSRRDVVIVSLADLTLQAERNRFLTLPIDLKSELLPEMIRIQAGDKFPYNLRALSVIGFFDSELAARKLKGIAVIGTDEHFGVAVNALSTMCDPSGALAINEIMATKLSSSRQATLADAIRRGEQSRQFCR
jgi:hypothetical protein